LHVQAERTQGELWSLARRSFQGDGSRGAFLFVEALGEINARLAKREDVLERHVPELVLVLLFSSFLISAGVVGFVAGGSGHRPSRLSYLMAGIIALLLFIVLDMDRPRRGLINVSQQSMVDVQALVHRTAASSAR
jgi:hypothetical protein